MPRRRMPDPLVPPEGWLTELHLELLTKTPPGRSLKRIRVSPRLAALAVGARDVEADPDVIGCHSAVVEWDDRSIATFSLRARPGARSR